MTVLLILLKISAVFGLVMLAVAYMTYIERKVLSFIQIRLGPNRVGWRGILQPIADGVKMIAKEIIIPAKADKWVYIVAPILTLIPALIVYAVIPFGENLYITDLNIGILYILAVSSLGIYGIVMAGWSSNNKYSLMGALRAAAQMISYEIPLGLSLIGVLILSQSLSMVDIVNAQSKVWFIFYQPIGFVVYLIAAIAETNRLPFDMPETESELVTGYHTEYSGMRFGVFFMAEYANMITVSAIAATLFFGGWRGPFLPSIVWFLIKVYAFLFLYVWLRGTLPRFRYDQVMDLGWRWLLPLAILNIILTSVGVIFGWQWVMTLVGLILLFIWFVLKIRSREVRGKEVKT